jgi:hypothetical protein
VETGILPAQAGIIGSNAQKFVQLNFAIPVMVEKTMQFYQKLHAKTEEIL